MLPCGASSGDAEVPSFQLFLSFKLGQYFVYGPETKVLKKLLESGFGPPQVHIMTKGLDRAGRQLWLAGIQLPRMYINRERPALGVDGPKSVSGQRVRIEPQIPAAADRPGMSKPSIDRQGKLPQRAARPADAVRLQRRLQ